MTTFMHTSGTVRSGSNVLTDVQVKRAIVVIVCLTELSSAAWALAIMAPGITKFYISTALGFCVLTPHTNVNRT